MKIYRLTPPCQGRRDRSAFPVPVAADASRLHFSRGTNEEIAPVQKASHPVVPWSCSPFFFPDCAQPKTENRAPFCTICTIMHHGAPFLQDFCAVLAVRAPSCTTTIVHGSAGATPKPHETKRDRLRPFDTSKKPLFQVSNGLKRSQKVVKGLKRSHPPSGRSFSLGAPASCRLRVPETRIATRSANPLLSPFHFESLPFSRPCHKTVGARQ